METIHPDGTWFLKPNPRIATAHKVPASPQDTQLKKTHGALPMDNMLFFLSSGKVTQWHRFLQNLNLAQEDNWKQQQR